jgi:hypothetical protein
MGDEYQIGGILGDPPFDDEGDEPMTDADLPSDEELVAVANRAYREVASAGANVSGASRAGRLAVARLAQQRERERGEAKLIAALAPLGVSMMDPPDGGDVSLYEQVERCVAEIARLKRDAEQANEAVQALSAGQPLGPVVGTHIIRNQLDEIARLNDLLAELRGAREKAMHHLESMRSWGGTDWRWHQPNAGMAWEALVATLTDTKAGGA